jgi:hypothetical protein
MLLDIGAQIAAGIIIGLALTTAAAVLLGLTPRHRAPEQTPPDPIPSGAVLTATTSAGIQPRTGRSDTDKTKTDPDDVPSGVRMTPINGWDVLTVGLVLAMALAAPPIAAALAPVIVVAVLIDAASRIWLLSTQAENSRRERRPPRPGG